MAVTPQNPGFAFNQVENTVTITDGLGSFINAQFVNAAETKFFRSKEVRFVASGDDKQGSLVSWAEGMPPGVDFVDLGQGRVRIEGTVSNNIIPDMPVSIYDLSEPSVSTGGVPGTYKLGDQVAIYKVFTITFKSKHLAQGQISFPMYVVKDWGNEMQALLNKVQSEYPE